MGASLDKPIREKDTERGPSWIGHHNGRNINEEYHPSKNNTNPSSQSQSRPSVSVPVPPSVPTPPLISLSGIRYAASRCQGYRPTMEDEHVSRVGNIDERLGVEFSIFAIMDGHGGNFVSKYASSNYLRILKEQEYFHRYASLPTQSLRDHDIGLNLLLSALIATNIQLDDEMLRLHREQQRQQQQQEQPPPQQQQQQQQVQVQIQKHPPQQQQPPPQQQGGQTQQNERIHRAIQLEKKMSSRPPKPNHNSNSGNIDGIGIGIGNNSSTSHNSSVDIHNKRDGKSAAAAASSAASVTGSNGITNGMIHGNGRGHHKHKRRNSNDNGYRRRRNSNDDGGGGAANRNRQHRRNSNDNGVRNRHNRRNSNDNGSRRSSNENGSRRSSNENGSRRSSNENGNGNGSTSTSNISGSCNNGNNNNHHKNNNQISHDDNGNDNNKNGHHNDGQHVDITGDGRTSGSTICAVVVTPSHIICANAGDSRAFYRTGGGSGGGNRRNNTQKRNGTTRTIQLSFDHKPTHDEERRRIESAGGYVAVKRVDGELAVSRGIGDLRFKGDDALKVHQQKVSPVPDFCVVRRNHDADEFIFLACDGIYDVLNCNQCSDLLSDLFDNGETDLGLAVEEVIDVCLDRQSKDNLTAILVAFPDNLSLPPMPPPPPPPHMLIPMSTDGAAAAGAALDGGEGGGGGSHRGQGHSQGVGAIVGGAVAKRRRERERAEFSQIYWDEPARAVDGIQNNSDGDGESQDEDQKKTNNDHHDDDDDDEEGNGSGGKWAIEDATRSMRQVTVSVA